VLSARIPVLETNLTPRLEELSRHRPIHPNYIGDRDTPIWDVTEGTLMAEPSSRLIDLSYPRPVHQDYKYERSVFTTVPEAAMKAPCTPRLDALSAPKPHKIWANSKDTVSEGEFNAPIWLVTDSARNARCSPRIETLSEAKREPVTFVGERTVSWPVTPNAMRAIATLRLQQLSRPKSGRMRKEDYDPYKVTFAAKNARATPRLSELCEPLPRKVRQKKA